jgi:hypothetical protein
MHNGPDTSGLFRFQIVHFVLFSEPFCHDSADFGERTFARVGSRAISGNLSRQYKGE